MIGMNDLVTPKTKAGVWTTESPTVGPIPKRQAGKNVFIGIGTIIDVYNTAIDYDNYPDPDDQGLGMVPYTSIKVKHNNGIGWVGEGAVNLIFKAAVCPDCKMISMKSASADLVTSLAGEWYCPKCNKIYFIKGDTKNKVQLNND